MKWEIPLLVSFVLLLGIFSSFPVVDGNFTIDENGLKHYVLTPEKNISSFDVIATSLSKYNREIDFDEQDAYFVFFLFVLLLVLLYRSNFVLQVKQSVLKTFASDYIKLFLKNNFAQTLFSENKNNVKEILAILSSSNTNLQNNRIVLYRNYSNVLINSKKFFVSKKIIVVLLFVVLIVPVYDQVYANSGDITKSLVDSYEFDNSYATYPFIVQVDSDTFAISYQGVNGQNDGYIQTFDITSAGIITSIDTLEFQPTGITFSNIVPVDSDTFAIAYRDTASGDGFIQTVDISGTGTITNGTAYEFDTARGNDPHIVAVDADTFAVAYQGNGNDGWLKTLNISSDGSTITQEDQFEYDTSNGRDNDIVRVDADTFLVVHRGVDNDGFARTINISTDGMINSIENTLEFDTDSAYYNDVTQIDADTFAVAYRDIDNDGRLVTLDVTSTGTITLVETLEYETVDASWPDIIKLDDKSVVIAYRGTGNDGFITTIDTSNELVFSDSDTLDVAESVDLIKKYAISGTSAPVPIHSAITTGNSIIDDANSTPTVTSSATALKGFFLNANSTPTVSDSGNTVAQYTRNVSDVLDVVEQNTEFKNYTISNSTTPNVVSSGTISFSINANSTPSLFSNATSSADISSNSTPVLISNATTVAMFVLDPSTTPSVSSTANVAFSLSANSTPSLFSNATTTGMFTISADSTPTISSNTTSSLSGSSTPVPSDDGQITGMFTLSANSAPSLSSNATSSADISGSSTPVPSDDGQITGMFTISANSTPSVDSHGSPRAHLFTSTSPTLSSNAQVTGMFTISANSTPAVSSTATTTGMFTISANSTPSLFSNATSLLSGVSTPTVLSNSTSAVVFTLSVTDTLDVVESQSQLKQLTISATSIPVISESSNTLKHSILTSTSVPRITEHASASGQYVLSANSVPVISESGNTSPRIKSTNVTSTTQIDIAFDRNMDPAYAQLSSFTLTNPSATVQETKISDNIVSLILDSAITSGQTPTIAITGGIVRDTDGNTVDSVIVVSDDKVPPKVVKAYATTKSSIVILFNKNVTSQLSDYSNLQMPMGTAKTINNHAVSGNAGTLTVNSADITARADGIITISSGLTDTLATPNPFDTNNNPVTVISNIEEAPVELDEDFSDLVITTEEIEIKEILVEENVDAKLDLSKSPTKTTVTENSITKNRVQITNEMKITTSDGTDEEVQIVIPKDILVSGPQDTFTGAIDLPEPKVGNSCPINSDGGNIVSCVDIGLSNAELTFNKPVKITLPNEGSLTPYYSTDNTTWQEITTLCDAADTAEVNGVAISNDGTRECYFVDDSDMIIWTTHFTVFGTLTPPASTSSSSGGDTSAPSISTSYGPSITDSGLGGIIGSTDQPLVPGAEIKNYPLVFDGIGYDENNFDSVHTAVIEAEKPLNVVLSLYENSGAQNIEHVEMYVNHFGPRVLNDRTETVIIYDKFTGIEIIDPYDLISSATVLPTLLDTQSQFYFQVFFEEEIEQSDVLFRAWDKNRNSVELHLPEALIVIKDESLSEESNVTESEIVSPADPSESDIVSPEIPPESEKVKIPSEPELGTYVGIPMDPERGVDVNLQMDPEPGVDVNLQMDPEPGVDVNLQMDPEPGVDVKKPKSLLDSISEFFDVLSKLLRF